MTTTMQRVRVQQTRTPRREQPPLDLRTPKGRQLPY